MSTTSFKIQAYGTPSSLVPGSIQNARNNNLGILTIVQTISFDETTLTIPENIFVEGSQIVGSTIETDIACSFKLGTNSPDFDNLLPVVSGPAGIYNLSANSSNPITFNPGDIIKFTQDLIPSIPPVTVKITLRLLIKKT